MWYNSREISHRRKNNDKARNGTFRYRLRGPGKEILPKVADRLKQNGSPLAPLLSGGMAANVLLRASDSVRDRMAAEILNAAAPRLTGTLEKLAADNGIPCKVQGLRATAAQK